MSNFIISDLISRLTIAKRNHLKSIMVRNTKLSRDIISIFYKNGLITGFTIVNENALIKIYLKYYQNKTSLFSIEVISKPGRRVFWSLAKMSLKYNNFSFSGFYIISTSSGLKTSNDCLFGYFCGGEVLMRIYV